MKRPFAALLAGILSIAMLCSISALSVEPAPLSDSALSVESASLSASSPQEYITFDQYLEKYGEETVIEGFKVAEARAMGYDQATLDSLSNPDPEVGKSLFESLSEGEFLGFKVLGISDVAPDSPNIMIRLDREGRMVGSTSSDISIDSSIAPQTEVIANNYKYYYTTNKPDQTALNHAYEYNAGSYFYKYSYSWQKCYQCDTTVAFQGTTLHNGTQDCIMYLFLVAKSDTATLDFGLMANPSDSGRNKGLYAFYNYNYNVSRDKKDEFYVESFPKVKASNYDPNSNTITLERKTVTIQLAVNTNQVAMSMESDGSNIFYLVYNAPGLISNTQKSLTFLQAMSCVEANGKYTQSTNGAYFKPVMFKDSKLYTAEGTKPFTVMGDYTYFTFVCRPNNITFGYSNPINVENVSIAYNNSENCSIASVDDNTTTNKHDKTTLDGMRSYIADLEWAGAHLDEYPSELGTLAVYRTPNPRTGAQYGAIFYRNDGTYIDFGSLLPACWHPYFNPRDIQFSEDGTLLTFISPIEEPDGSMSTIEWGDTLCTVDLTTGKMLSMEPINLSP